MIVTQCGRRVNRLKGGEEEEEEVPNGEGVGPGLMEEATEAVTGIAGEKEEEERSLR